MAMIDQKRWDADCEAAFELAVPPQWEVRDRGRGSFGAWRALPEVVSAALNDIARRGQRRGNVAVGGYDFAVDLQDMVATTTMQPLRKTARRPSINTKALKAFYARYAEEAPPADHPAGPDGVVGENFLRLFADLVIDPGTDVAALALAAACRADEMGIFRRREFICGCAALEVDSLEAMREQVPRIRSEVLSGKTLPEVYSYTFAVALETGSKVLPMEEARQYWSLLLHAWPLREEFCDWASNQSRGKTVNRDLWMMVLKLATEVPADLSTYDEDPAWPVVLDDFVEYYREKQGK